MEVAAAAEQDLEELRPEPRAGVGSGGGGHLSPWKRSARGSGGGVAAAGTRILLGAEPLQLLPLCHQVPAPHPPRDGHVREVSAGAREEHVRRGDGLRARAVCAPLCVGRPALRGEEKK